MISPFGASPGTTVSPLSQKDSDFHEFSLLYGNPPKVIWLKCGNKPKWYVLGLLLNNQEKIKAFFDDEQTSCLEIY
jgi:predicted nuclease of predicted toxin-antitoxin system